MPGVWLASHVASHSVRPTALAAVLCDCVSVEYKGYGGSILVTDDAITITHSGLVGKAAGAATGVPRRIPLAAISDVAFKEANALVNGHIGFGLGGAKAPKYLENPAEYVQFRRKDSAAFATLHSWLLQLVQHNKAMGIDPSTTDFPSQQRNRFGRFEDRVNSLSDELSSMGSTSEEVLAEGFVPDSLLPRRFTIFKDGTFFYTGMDRADRLLGFEIDQDSMRRKSATGRGAAFLVTGGVSALASNNRGVAYLTVVGESTGTKTFTVQNPPSNVLSTLRSLSAAASGLLSGVRDEGRSSPSPAAEEIRALAALRDQGILTEVEFETKKRQILGI